MVEKLLANPYIGSTHPDYHLIYLIEISGLFKLSGLQGDKVKKKVFRLSLEEKDMMWYNLLDDIGSWDWNHLKLEFHQIFHPMHLIHHGRNFIYNCWPHEGESIAQDWGGLNL